MNLKKLPSSLKGGIIGCAITIAIFVLAPVVSKWDTVTVMAAVTIAVTLCNGIIPAYVSYRTSGKKALCMQTGVSVNVSDNGMVTVSAWIENIGYKRFDTKIANLYIDKGKQIDSSEGIISYKFPQLLEHKEQGERYDCILAERCYKDDTAYPVLRDLGISDEGAYEKLGASIKLRHLSHGSVDFLLPGEKFSEDIVIKLKGGVYRITLVCVTKTMGCECSCSTKQFYVPGYGDEKSEEKSEEKLEEKINGYPHCEGFSEKGVCKNCAILSGVL